MAVGQWLQMFHSYFTLSYEVHGYNTKLASWGDLLLTKKLHSNVELGQFSIQVQDFGTQFLF